MDQTLKTEPRKLTDHHVDGKCAVGEIVVADEPGPGGANHVYDILYPCDADDLPGLRVRFQNGPIDENGEGVNGIQNEDLLAIVIDRMRGFQSGTYSCRENAIALTHLETALMWLQRRTRDRIARNVEGTHQK